MTFQKPQERDLRYRRQGIYFIQKKCSLVGLSYKTDLGFFCIRESSSLMTKQFVLDEIVWNRPTVNGNERPMSSAAELMYGARGKLLPRASFTLYQHRCFTPGELHKVVHCSKEFR